MAIFIIQKISVGLLALSMILGFAAMCIFAGDFASDVCNHNPFLCQVTTRSYGYGFVMDVLAWLLSLAILAVDGHMSKYYTFYVHKANIFTYDTYDHLVYKMSR